MKFKDDKTFSAYVKSKLHSGYITVLFKGPLNAVAEGVKCNYIIYWSGDHGMELVGPLRGKSMMETKSNKIHTGHNLRITYTLKQIN